MLDDSDVIHTALTFVTPIGAAELCEAAAEALRADASEITKALIGKQES